VALVGAVVIVEHVAEGSLMTPLMVIPAPAQTNMATKPTKAEPNFADTILVGNTKILTSGELIAYLSKFPIGTPVTGSSMNQLLIGEYTDALCEDEYILIFDQTTRPRIK